MLSKQSPNFSWTRRINILLAVVFLILAIIGFKLFQKTVLEHPKYEAMAQDQQQAKKEIFATRGNIYTQDHSTGENYPIALSTKKYNLNIIPKNVTDPNLTADKLASIIDMNRDDLFNQINNQKLYLPPIKKRLSQEVADKINDLTLPGVYLDTTEARYYPENTLASQVLGFVDANNDGQYGLEQYYNSELKGQNGWEIAEQDAYGDTITSNQKQDAQNGSNLILTIDHNLQYYVEQKLAEAKKTFDAESGSIIVMDPKTGGILAMASDPNYDPNKYNEVPVDKQNLFLNPAVSLEWEPGSIFKPITMAVALNEGKIEPDMQDTFSNYVTVDGYQIHTAQDKAFGKETMTQCLENSDNVCLVWVADKLGNDTFYNYINSFGFGKTTNIDLAGEASGSLLDLGNWRDISRATISFGQGIAVTPLQMLTAIAAVANGGNLVKPHIVSEIVKSNNDIVNIETQTVGQVIKPEAAKKLTSMMISVVENGHGKKAKVPGYAIAGKTGTAQVPKPEGGYYEDQHIGSFAGFFPADDPKFAMIVKLDKPKNVEWAESSAAPTFGDIAGWLLNYYQISPTE